MDGKTVVIVIVWGDQGPVYKYIVIHPGGAKNFIVPDDHTQLAINSLLLGMVENGETSTGNNSNNCSTNGGESSERPEDSETTPGSIIDRWATSHAPRPTTATTPRTGHSTHKNEGNLTDESCAAGSTVNVPDYGHTTSRTFVSTTSQYSENPATESATMTTPACDGPTKDNPKNNHSSNAREKGNEWTTDGPILSMIPSGNITVDDAGEVDRDAAYLDYYDDVDSRVITRPLGDGVLLKIINNVRLKFVMDDKQTVNETDHFKHIPRRHVLNINT